MKRIVEPDPLHKGAWHIVNAETRRPVVHNLPEREARDFAARMERNAKKQAEAMNDKPINWLRIRSLPPQEQQPFLNFLAQQTRPWIEGESVEDQDGYDESDYLNWKRVSATRYWD